MEQKTQIVEKRIKSTIIRRRANIVEKEAQAVESKESPTAVSTSPQTEGAALVQQSTDITTAVSNVAEPRFIKLPPKPESKIPGIPDLTSLVTLSDAEKEEEEKKNRLKKVVKKKDDKIEVDEEEFGRISDISQITRIAHTDTSRVGVERVFKPSRLSKKKKIVSRKGLQKTLITETKASKRIVEMKDTIWVGDLAKAMGIKSGVIIKKLMDMGTMATVNQPLDFDTACVIAQEYKYEVKNVAFNEQKVFNDAQKNIHEKLEARPPIVTVMGHVDHGKTSLLDAIRKSNVVDFEAGGITQHIGAYTVSFPKGKITFLDTPGHEAFTAMRARGASVTDLVVLVVAADDGMMPQTLESIDHAKAAEVPLVVAVNKIDKPEADLDRVKRQLSERGLSPEEWGGDTLYCPVSAKKKQGISELLEAILLQSEVLELKADVNAMAEGTVIESRLDRNRGPICTILVQKGILKVGDAVVAGTTFGRVRAMMDDKGVAVDSAHPSYAVQVMGITEVPHASDIFNVVEDERVAKDIAENRADQKRKLAQAQNSKISLEDFFAKSQGQEIKELSIVVKTDVHGSLEAVTESLNKIVSEKVKVKVVHSAVGGISESDVLLASASHAIIIGFNVRPETMALNVAKSEGVDIKLYKIIYEMVNDVKLAMQGLLAPTKKEKYLGRTEVRQVFSISKVGSVAGCYVVDGNIARSAHLRLLRDNVVIYEGKVSSLKRFKDDVKEVAQGFECGMNIEGYNDVKTGDVIEAFEIELIQTSL
ncbi:MAG: translation initiation factor IF-2 [Deltaproteobacteria bacterium RIFCSPLOWO2_12_FULL_40_28]|nr:MAG: translation initiation factor IF-2 [Deltaproteobacteria bacterium RIFCSPHIGHO2_02_FULL_40_28]OGQ20352.1 MAG: translation initiation factor IF-2 [Deltaproteobacteria bacterium RIFCSPHIGHO2_12_FULL_40_32]OGQ41321.1 MAG: translation initiation factor IF-2 [Deltaproteobacteria bacterium RIFCSPLOWO2_02_FULL_40_36]OGQ54960.1 MAG: translation initiation factor IF-2 [Deltaproteobacteria bacterium RIFCSPLOWO2_12_FULL_40_28]